MRCRLRDQMLPPVRDYKPKGLRGTAYRCRDCMRYVSADELSACIGGDSWRCASCHEAREVRIVAHAERIEREMPDDERDVIDRAHDTAITGWRRRQRRLAEAQR